MFLILYVEVLFRATPPHLGESVVIGQLWRSQRSAVTAINSSPIYISGHVAGNTNSAMDNSISRQGRTRTDSSISNIAVNRVQQSDTPNVCFLLSLHRQKPPSILLQSKWMLLRSFQKTICKTEIRKTWEIEIKSHLPLWVFYKVTVFCPTSQTRLKKSIFTGYKTKILKISVTIEGYDNAIMKFKHDFSEIRVTCKWQDKFFVHQMKSHKEW